MEQTDKFSEAVNLLISKGISPNEAAEWVGWNGYEEAFEVFGGNNSDIKVSNLQGYGDE